MKKRYLVFMNIGGGIHPIKELSKTDNGWWDKTGNYDGGKLGWEKERFCMKFTTISRNEARLVYEGARSFAAMVKELTK